MAKKSAGKGSEKGPRKGPVGFEEFYGASFGERWPELREALQAPVQQVARINRFADTSFVEERAKGFPRADFGGSEALLLSPGQKIEIKTDACGLTDFYVMDAASIFAAAALEAKPGEEILDLCAAPGGKSLILADRLFADGRPENKQENDSQAQGGRLVSNEMSDRRRARLRAVFEDYVPPGKRERIRVTGHDGVRWCLHETESFDRILVDAPCSGERHLLASPEEMKLWSPARSKNLAVRQYALLASALAVVRKGGRIVYSTCSISNLENDAIIARLMKKRAGEARVLIPRLEIGEATENGWMILPDRTGYGPIYFSAIERL